jgi:hypothetical protein
MDHELDSMPAKPCITTPSVCPPWTANLGSGAPMRIVLAAALAICVLLVGTPTAPPAHADFYKTQYWTSLVCQPGTYTDRIGSSPAVPHATAVGLCPARTNGVTVYAATFPSRSVAMYDVGRLYFYHGGGGTFASAGMPNGVAVVYYAPGDSGHALEPLLNDGLVALPYPPGPGATAVPFA